METSSTSQRRTLESRLTATLAESKRIRREIGERETRDDLQDLRLAMLLTNIPFTLNFRAVN